MLLLCPGFTNVLKILTRESSREELLSFIQHYGSHYIAEALYGSELTCIIHFPSKKVQQQLWLQYQKGKAPASWILALPRLSCVALGIPCPSLGLRFPADRMRGCVMISQDSFSSGIFGDPKVAGWAPKFLPVLQPPRFQLSPETTVGEELEGREPRLLDTSFSPASGKSPRRAPAPLGGLTLCLRGQFPVCPVESILSSGRVRRSYVPSILSWYQNWDSSGQTQETRLCHSPWELRSLPTSVFPFL